MAKATPKAGEMRRVRFTAMPPARLVADDVVIEAGNEGELPAALAEELAANPHMNLELLDDEASAEDADKEE